MAKLSAFRINSKAIRDGEWVPLGAEFGDVEIRTRGLTDAYHDAQARRQKTAAMTLPPPDTGSVERLPISQKRNINVECLIEFVLLDVRNLTQDDGETPVGFTEFCRMLRDPDYEPLVDAAYLAALTVGRRREADAKEAAGN